MDMAVLFKSALNKFSSLFFRKTTSFVLVAIGSDLKLLNIELEGPPRISAYKTLALPAEKKDQFVVDSLRGFIRENNIEHNNGMLIPSLKSLLVKRLQLPAVPEHELLQTLRWQIKDEASFDTAKAVIDFQVIRRETKSDGSESLDIVCAAAEHDEVETQAMLLRQAGLVCMAVNIPACGYGKLIEKYLGVPNEEAVGILRLKEGSCFISFYKNNKLEFYRELPVTINMLKESLGVALVRQGGRVELSGQQIDEILFKTGIPFDEPKDDSGLSAHILGLLRPALERLTLEIKRSVLYYDAQYRGGRVKRIILVSKGADLVNLDKFLSRELLIDVSAFAPKDKAGLAGALSAGALSEYLGVFGCGLDYAQGINLLPDEFRGEKIERLQKVSLRWISFSAALFLLVSFLLGSAAISAYNRRLENALYQLTVSSEIKQIKAEIDAIKAFELEANSSDIRADMVLKKLSNVAPREMFFNSLALDCDSKTGSISGFVKALNANPDDILTQFIGAINDSGYFKDVNISSLTKSVVQGQSVISFEIRFRL